MKIALAQINPTVGDFSGNVGKIFSWYDKNSDADLVVAPELAIAGYPCEDLIINHAFADAARAHAEHLAQKTDRRGIVVGLPWREGDLVYNAAALLCDGKIAQVTYKHELPNYGVFDEKRNFAQAPLPQPILFQGARIGVLICEDMWFPSAAQQFRKSGAKILISINGSPFDCDKEAIRNAHAHDRVTESGLPLIYVNMVGGQDELVFDGASFAMDRGGKIIGQLPRFVESSGAVEFDPTNGNITTTMPKSDFVNDDLADVYHAIVLATRDYVRKNGFAKVLLGLSGGIDSALVAAIAVDALEAKNVRGVMLPSPYTSADSIEDAMAVAKNLGIAIDSISISEMMKVAEASIAPVQKLSGLSLENIQPRLRGLSLMAISNQTGALLLSTGNKSEIAMGYATLYGDMCGAFNPIKDLYKTQVYALAKWRNEQSPVIPERILTKPPSAELKPNQTDQDTLPPYDILDKILYKLIEDDQSIGDIIAHGYERSLVVQIAAMLDRAEYKRRQACIGPKISIKSFGKDRRYPMTSRWNRL